MSAAVLDRGLVERLVREAIGRRVDGNGAGNGQAATLVPKAEKVQKAGAPRRPARSSQAARSSSAASTT